MANQPLPVCDTAPEGAEVLGEIAASSRRSSARTTSAKRNYVMRELQRQARLFGAEGIHLRSVREMSEYKPQYGQRRGSFQYQEIVHLYGSGSALRFADDQALPKDCHTTSQ